MYAGFSNAFVIALALLGVVGILFELHVLPGHGFAGILGTLALGAAVVLSFGAAFFFVAVQALSIAIVLSAIAFWVAARVFPENAFVSACLAAARARTTSPAGLTARLSAAPAWPPRSCARPASPSSTGTASTC